MGGGENDIHSGLWAQLIEEVNWVWLRVKAFTGKPGEDHSSWASLSTVAPGKPENKRGFQVGLSQGSQLWESLEGPKGLLDLGLSKSMHFLTFEKDML